MRQYAQTDCQDTHCFSPTFCFTLDSLSLVNRTAHIYVVNNFDIIIQYPKINKYLLILYN